MRLKYQDVEEGEGLCRFKMSGVAGIPGRKLSLNFLFYQERR
jgi:hypothetical protein